MKKIAIYGKGGIGKSTTTSNLSAALSEMGLKVMQIGCAGRGIITAFEKLEELHAYDVYDPDIVLYDVLGDVVCGGFAMPIRGGYADQVIIVTSGEMMALFAADNISHAIRNFGKRGYARLAGYIQNSRNVENEDSIVSQAASENDTEVLYIVPRDGAVQLAESEGKTVIEALPQSEMAERYRQLARKVMEVTDAVLV